MDSRRKFIGSVASGIAGSLAPSSVLGANDRLRLGILGAGERGMELAREAASCTNAEVVAAADIYSRRLESATREYAAVRTYADYRQLLDDKAIDAVLIATPQHLHCEHFLAALDAGKHVYQEMAMAFNVDHAKRMRAAYQKTAGKRTVQIGHQHISSGPALDAVDLLKAGKLGRITAIQAHFHRNTPHGKPQWQRPVYPDMTPENLGWTSFLGDAPAHPFDANRYANWRFYWDYSGGNVYENMCQQLAFWYKPLNLQIPRAVTMVGGIYLWKDGREVPDTTTVTMQHPEEILFTWVAGFGNNHLGAAEHVLGTDGTIVRSQQIRYLPQKVNQPQGQEVLGRQVTKPRAHMQNFLDSIRQSREPNCPVEIGYRVSIACRMAVESYRLGRTVRWDPVQEEIQA